MSIQDLFNVLLSEKPSTIIQENEKEIFKLIPELKICKGFNQNNEWHIYDVYQHILHVVDYVPNDIVLRLAALFHDIGKPYSYTEDENKIGHFYGHWDESRKIFDAFAIKYNLDIKMSYLISNLIYYHDINISKMDEEKLFEMMQKLGIEGVQKLYELKRADLLSQNKKYHYILSDYDEQQKLLLSKYKEDFNKKIGI